MKYGFVKHALDICKANTAVALKMIMLNSSQHISEECSIQVIMRRPNQLKS